MSKKQAVLLIHGIGEQPPMATLRGFVEAVWTNDEKLHHGHVKGDKNAIWSKPDTVSESYELRRLTTPKNRGDIRTDFFEFYWAHLMEGTGYGHVLSWLRTILWRTPSSVPSHLRFAYFVLWIGIPITIAAAIYAATTIRGIPETTLEWLSPIVTAVGGTLVGRVIKDIIGDAARYLHVAPTNVQRRHEIRHAGVQLLRNLHARDEYDRIIVVGHSLGSVIGYDILTHTWPEFNDAKAPAKDAPIAKLEILETLANGGVVDPPKTMREAQRDYFVECKTNGNKWRVTDFVTLGSPLAHAEILLAKDAAELDKKQEDREFPTCLPTLEALKDGTVRRFSFNPDETAKHRMPHHAAVFALTRWTNLYFPCSAIVKGDLVGGQIAPVFGSGVTDVKVATSLRGGFLSHTLYWKPEPEGKSTHIDALRAALDLADDAKVTA